MKQVSQSSSAGEYLAYESALKHIQEIFGETGIELDVQCVHSICISKKAQCRVIYNKIKVTTNDERVFYWPIQNYEKPISFELSREMISQMN